MRVLHSDHQVAAIIDWVLNEPFVLSINFHDGAVGAFYGYDDSHGADRVKVGRLFSVTKQLKPF